MEVIYEDNHLLVVNKPAGQLVQGDQTGRRTLLDEARTWLKEKYGKPGNVFLGLVHRLDRPASGAVVLAKTSKAASRLSEEFRAHTPRKIYWAIVEGETPEAGVWTDRLERDSYESRIVETPGGKEARLSFKRTDYTEDLSTLTINLETGRHHQIRVQFAHRGHPVQGDRRYGSTQAHHDGAIALHARLMRIRHPTRQEEMTFVAEVGVGWPNVVANEQE